MKTFETIVKEVIKDYKGQYSLTQKGMNQHARDVAKEAFDCYNEQQRPAKQSTKGELYEKIKELILKLLPEEKYGENYEAERLWIIVEQLFNEPAS